MSEECTHNCSTCGSNCGQRTEDFDFTAHLAQGASVKHVYAVMSGKGGVGKSLITSLLASAFSKKGYRTAILDADITGPSIPKAFGMPKELLTATKDTNLFIPAVSRGGVQMISSNLLLENETDPIIWRGALIAGIVKQFFSDALWNDVDYMFVDMPPGTGDVPLTVFQSLPIEGIIMVTSPQDLVSMIVGKAVNMAKKMDIPVLGIVENMSYAVCPGCNTKFNIFGESHIDEIADEYGIEVLSKLPVDPNTAKLVDEGKVEDVDVSCMDKAVKLIINNG